MIKGGVLAANIGNLDFKTDNSMNIKSSTDNTSSNNIDDKSSPEKIINKEKENISTLSNEL